MYDTVKLIVQGLAIVNHHVDTFGDVTEENEWIQGWGSYGYGYGSSWSKYDDYGYSTNYSTNSKSTSKYYEQELAYSRSSYGDVEMVDLGGMISITQGNGKDQQEILLSAGDLEDLVLQYFDSKYDTRGKDEADLVRGGKIDTTKELVEEDLPF